jgi:hypothetical protein
MQAVERPDAPDVPDGYVGGLGLLALVDAEQKRAGSAGASARQAISFARKRFQADSWIVSLAHFGLALACTATGQFDEAEHEALSGSRDGCPSRLPQNRTYAVRIRLLGTAGC